MTNYLMELCVSEYFSLSAVLGEHLQERKKLFDLLGKVFLQSKETVEELFQAVESKEVLEVDSEASYFRHCRARQYCALMEIDLEMEELIVDLIAIKGNAIMAMKNHDLTGDYEDGVAATQNRLVHAANRGSISALRMLGLMQSEGIFTERNQEAGFKNLKKATNWNNVEGLMYALYYDEKSRKDNMARLELVLTALMQTEALTTAKKAYPYSAKPSVEAKLMEKAFNCGFFQRDVFSPQYARIIYSETIQANDKERLLFATSKEMLAEMSELPLKLSGKKELTVDYTALDEMPLQREEERKRLEGCLRNADLRKMPTYRPLCLSCESDYVKHVYLQGFTNALDGANLEVIEVADLIGYDFEPTKSHIFVRSCDEHRANVYVLVFKGEIQEQTFDQVKVFLQSSKRKNFRLHRPSVCMDLGAVLPVCICDKQNEGKLKRFCDVVTLSDVKNEEREGAIAAILAEKTELYGVEGIELSEDARSWLCARATDEADELLDKAIRLNRNGQERLILTKEQVGGSGGNGARKNGYGFGGATYDNQ